MKDILNNPQIRWQALFSQAPELARTNVNDLIELLITALSAPERSVYLPAAYILRHVTRENHGFRAFGTAQERLAACDAWARWWEEARPGFNSRMPPLEQATLIVDEIPGRIVGNDDEPPGRVARLNSAGQVAWEINTLKMPYDAAQMADGSYLVNIIRARAVWKVSPDGEIMWKRDVGGYPCSLQLLPTGHCLVAGWDDDVPGFAREFDAKGNEVWKLEHLCWPWKAQRLENGHTLVADAGANRVFEVDAEGKEVWAVDNLGPEKPELFDALGPVYCQRLDDGNTLVSIRGLCKVVELDPAGEVVWKVGKDIVHNQYSAVRLWNGNTLIADGGNFRVIEIDVDKNIVWEKPGFGYPAKAYRY